LTETKFYKSEKLFTGETWLLDHAVIVTNGIIEKVIPVSSLPGDIVQESFPGYFLAPALIDLQIYGAHKKLFAVYPEADSLYALKDYCNAGGAAYFLPTVATNLPAVFYRCIDAIKDYWNKGGEGVLGLHIEGPWINPVKRGAHIESFIHSPTLAEAKELLEYGKDVIKMITLAPEVCSREVINLVQSYGVVISAGHSNATYKQAIQGFDYGIKTATHLYNAMSSLQHREPGLVGAVFNDERVRCSIIADGHHVDYEAIRIANKIVAERLFAITDAVTETTEGHYQHYLAGDKYESSGILSGSALTMNKALRNLISHAGVELERALRMCSSHPAQVMGLENKLGKIEKGYKAKMIVLNNTLELVKLIG